MIRGYKKLPRTMLAQVQLQSEAIAEGDDLVQQINEVCRPPVPVTVDDVYVRRMRVIGDGIFDKYGWPMRLATSELGRVLELLQGQPMMVNHQREKLPVGRWFGGEVVERDGVTWVVANFYWMREADAALNLRPNFDGGIYREASTSFRHTTHRCSICGGDLNVCAHYPGERYEGLLCVDVLSGVDRVYEASLVDRGAHPGTGAEPGVRLQEDYNENQIEEEDGMTMEQTLELGVAIGLSAGEATPEALLARVRALATENQSLRADAEAGRAHLTARRAEVEGLLVQLSAFTKSEASDTDKAAIKSMNLEQLAVQERAMKAALGASLPEYRCPKCGEQITQLRASMPAPDERAEQRSIKITEYRV